MYYSRTRLLVFPYSQVHRRLMPQTLSNEVNGNTHDERDGTYNNFFQSYQPSSPLAPSHPSHLQLPQLFSPRRLWNFVIHAQHRSPANESIPLQERPKCSFFARNTAPRPVTVSAARIKKREQWIRCSFVVLHI
ncbi:hypothetical protein K503DRAFT_776169 [Rhizopogon vinicolor AM-OR11-026]|uniref:Uncharacterized protein n=1 Tax=Rhizopogon vinicolor AM-OR11-026 TaxID=1314800 RepID=A0A1B7MJX9_9AGAM|nr:hypothetical protein K503DRAFT_776169 [Rhizopogon vinicolor AM-OR11-026]